MSQKPKGMFSEVVGDGNNYAVLYRDRGLSITFIGKVVSFDGKFVRLRNGNEERIVSISLIKVVRKI